MNKSSIEKLVDTLDAIFNSISKKRIKEPNKLEKVKDDAWILLTNWKGFDEDEGTFRKNAKRALRARSLMVIPKYPSLSVIINGGEKMMFKPDDHEYAFKLIKNTIKEML